MLVEILPNARGPLIVDLFLRLGYTTIAIGALGFLGIGLPPPDPDWGGMVKETYGMIFVWPHMTLFPRGGDFVAGDRVQLPRRPACRRWRAMADDPRASRASPSSTTSRGGCRDRIIDDV